MGPLPGVYALTCKTGFTPSRFLAPPFLSSVGDFRFGTRRLRRGPLPFFPSGTPLGVLLQMHSWHDMSVTRDPGANDKQGHSCNYSRNIVMLEHRRVQVYENLYGRGLSKSLTSGKGCHVGLRREL